MYRNVESWFIGRLLQNTPNQGSDAYFSKLVDKERIVKAIDARIKIELA